MQQRGERKNYNLFFLFNILQMKINYDVKNKNFKMNQLLLEFNFLPEAENRSDKNLDWVIRKADAG